MSACLDIYAPVNAGDLRYEKVILFWSLLAYWVQFAAGTFVVGKPKPNSQLWLLQHYFSVTGMCKAVQVLGSLVEVRRQVPNQQQNLCQFTPCELMAPFLWHLK